MNNYVRTPAEMEGATITNQRYLAIKLASMGGRSIAETEKKGKPTTGIQCFSIPPAVLQSIGITPVTPAFSEVITLRGPEFNPRPHPSEPSVEKRTFVVHYASGCATVAPFLVVRGRKTDKKARSSALNGLREARRRTQKIILSR